MYNASRETECGEQEEQSTKRGMKGFEIVTNTEDGQRKSNIQIISILEEEKASFLALAKELMLNTSIKKKKTLTWN